MGGKVQSVATTYFSALDSVPVTKNERTRSERRIFLSMMVLLAKV